MSFMEAINIVVVHKCSFFGCAHATSSVLIITSYIKERVLKAHKPSTPFF